MATMIEMPAAAAAHQEDEPGIEYDGVHWIEKPMSTASIAVAFTIASLMRDAAKPTSAGRAFTEMPYRCYPDEPAKFRRPDASFVRHDRLPADWLALPMMPVPADLAVEVVSPTDLMYDVDAKVEEYLAAGFGTVWVVNPIAKTVRVYGSVRPPPLLYADDEITGEPFLPAFRCKVAAFFE